MIQKKITMLIRAIVPKKIILFIASMVRYVVSKSFGLDIDNPIATSVNDLAVFFDQRMLEIEKRLCKVENCLEDTDSTNPQMEVLTVDCNKSGIE